MKIILSVQEEPQGSKKPKKAVSVVWNSDRDGYPLPLVQQRFKGCHSLRKQDGTEYSWNALSRLATKKEVIFASEQESSLSVSKKMPSKKTDSTPMAPSPPYLVGRSAHSNCSLCAEFEACETIHMSRHAVQRCCEINITLENLKNVLQENNINLERLAARKHGIKERLVLGDTCLVFGHDGTIITAFETAKAGAPRSRFDKKLERVPCRHIVAHGMKKCGLIRIFQEQFHIFAKYNYDSEEFELRGDIEKLRMVKNILRNCVVQVPAPSEQAIGQVIGRQGKNIEALKTTLGVARMSVEWDDTSSRLVLVAPADISEHFEKIHQFVTECTTKNQKKATQFKRRGGRRIK